MIKDLNKEGKTKVRGLITKCDTGKTGKGTPYLSLTIEDRTGQLDAKFWNLTEEQTGQYRTGQVVDAAGDIILHRNAIQLRVRRMDVVEDADMLDYVRQAPASRQELAERTDALLDSMQEGLYKDVAADLLGRYRQQFLTWPAATKNHHNYVGGLAWHTLSMAAAADALLPLYPFLDRDLLMAGILLHDLGKIEELSAPMLPEYTPEGNLVGHITLAAGWIEEAVQRTGHEKDREEAMLLKHMVLSHHGKQEFGSPVVPMIPEAEVLSMVDDLDARLYMMKQSIDVTAPGCFGPRVFALENRMIYRRKEEEQA